MSGQEPACGEQSVRLPRRPYPDRERQKYDMATTRPFGDGVGFSALPGRATITEMVFLIGAGFNVDAVEEAGPICGTSMYIGRFQIPCGYPLVADALRLCFGLQEVPRGKSVEDLFAEALESGDYSPMERLSQRLMEADYRLATKLASATEPNCYKHFFGRFSRKHFLTFNYDSMIETFLLRLGHWYPHDGYGVDVEAERSPWINESIGQSASLILHLHGSLCLYTRGFEIRRDPRDHCAMLVERERPRFIFDPDSIPSNFPGYERLPPGLGYEPIEHRVVAPVPNKAKGLKQMFVNESYAKATSLVRSSGNLVAVGYSFNSHDRVSYHPILTALGESRDRKLLLVTPEADRVVDRLMTEYPHISIEPIGDTLKDWVAGSFRGLTEVHY